VGAKKNFSTTSPNLRPETIWLTATAAFLSRPPSLPPPLGDPKEGKKVKL